MVFAGGGVRLSRRACRVPRADREAGRAGRHRRGTRTTCCGTTIRSTAGRPGTIGDRGGNMVTQSADLLLVLGSRLNIRQVSYNWTQLRARGVQDLGRYRPARTAEAERHARHAGRRRPQGPDPRADRRGLCRADARSTASGWTGRSERVRRVPGRAARISRTTRSCHPYVAMEALFDALDEDDIVVTGNGSACVVSFQTADLKKGQRLWTNSGCATMGYDLPAAIGVCAATGCDKRVICIAGDGSIMMNMQEMQTIAGYEPAGEGLPAEQQRLCLDLPDAPQLLQRRRGRRRAQEQRHLPDFGKVATAFGFAYFARASATTSWRRRSVRRSTRRGPVMCEIVIDENVPLRAQARRQAASRRPHHVARAGGSVAVPPTRGVAREHAHRPDGRVSVEKISRSSALSRAAASRPARFVFAGMLNTGFGLAIYPLLLWSLPVLRTHYLGALMIAQAVSILFAYSTYKLSVFRTRANVAREFGMFSSFYVIASVINWAALPFAVEVLHIAPIPAQLGFSFILMVASYFWHSRITFRTTEIH